MGDVADILATLNVDEATVSYAELLAAFDTILTLART
jgi:hypothetical protein